MACIALSFSLAAPTMSAGGTLVRRTWVPKPADASPDYKPAQPDPKTQTNAKPKYPSSMKDTFVTGEVLVEYVVDTKGKVRTPKIIRSNDPHFEKPAIDSVMKLRFTPATQNGKPVEETQQMTLYFNPPNS